MKITLNNVGSLIDTTTAQNTLNSNFSILQTAFDDTFSRDGTSPNTMVAPIDMNSNAIFNLPAPIGINSPLRLQDLTAFTGGGTVSGVPAGGTTGQSLVKNSNTNFDMAYANRVSSVGLSMPSTFAVTNSPITSSGTLTAAWQNQAQNSVFAGPISGGAGAPTFRTLTSTDLATSATGTGNFVLQTSPTLITPLLGTPTSGNLVNCTGVTTAVGSITGLGTGVATALGTNVGSTGSIVPQGNAANFAAITSTGIVKAADHFEENNTTNHGYKLQARTLGALLFPVPALQPTQANSVLALDLMPTGTPTESPGNGFTWFDACDADIMTSNTNPCHCARIAQTSTGAQVGSANFNGATALPLQFIVGTNTVKASIDTNGKLKVGTGTDTPVFSGSLFEVNPTTASPAVIARDSVNHSEWFAIASTPAVYSGSATNHPYVIRTNNVDRATFDTSGNMTLTGGVFGVANNTSAATGIIGEYVTSNQPVGSAIAMTSGAPINALNASSSNGLDHIVLTAGDWDVTAQAYMLLAATTNYTNFQYSVSTTTGTLSTVAGNWINTQTAAAGIVPGSSNITFGSVSTRISVNSTTNVFLVAQAAFTVSTASVWGIISARRAR